MEAEALFVVMAASAAKVALEGVSVPSGVWVALVVV